MCTLAKLFSISIIIENNFAGVNMSFWVPSDRTRAGFSVSLIHIFLVDLLLQQNNISIIIIGFWYRLGVHMSFWILTPSAHSVYIQRNPEVHVYTGEIVLFPLSSCVFLKNLETHVYTGEIVFLPIQNNSVYEQRERVGVLYVFYFHYHH